MDIAGAQILHKFGWQQLDRRCRPNFSFWHGKNNRCNDNFIYFPVPVLIQPEFLATNRGPGFDSRRCKTFLSSSGSGTGSTQPREQFEELLWRNSSGSRFRKSKLRSEGLIALTTLHPLSDKDGTSFTDRRRSLDRNSLLADSKPRSYSDGMINWKIT
jgi:hypothetical protein